jgi:hypothetical protein
MTRTRTREPRCGSSTRINLRRLCSGISPKRAVFLVDGGLLVVTAVGALDDDPMGSIPSCMLGGIDAPPTLSVG